MPGPFREEVIVPYVDGFADAPVTTHCRGTLLIASRSALKDRGHYVRIEMKGQPLSSVHYFRTSYRGFIRAGCELFAKRVVVAELDAFMSDTTCAYRVAWV